MRKIVCLTFNHPDYSEIWGKFFLQKKGGWLQKGFHKLNRKVNWDFFHTQTVSQKVLNFPPKFNSFLYFIYPLFCPFLKLRFYSPKFFNGGNFP